MPDCGKNVHAYGELALPASFKMVVYNAGAFFVLRLFIP